MAVEKSRLVGCTRKKPMMSTILVSRRAWSFQEDSLKFEIMLELPPQPHLWTYSLLSRDSLVSSFKVRSC